MSLNSNDIAAIRKDYQLAELDENTAGTDPIAFFQTWFMEAHNAAAYEVNAMTLCTVGADNKPHARIVLLKGLDENGFTFFTNYNSHKGHDIATNPNVALVFFWKELERQVRIEGFARKVSDDESDQYFHSRPTNSRLGTWSSPQSQLIPGRHIISSNYVNYEKQFGDDIPRPPHWGGYLVIPSRIEFWQGRASRLHDRILFTRSSQGTWDKCRLAP